MGEICTHDEYYALLDRVKQAEKRAALLQAVADAAEQLFTFTPLREGETHLVMFTPALTLRYNVLGQAIKKWREAAQEQPQEGSSEHEV